MGWSITIDLIDGQDRETSHTVQLANSIATIVDAQNALDAFLADWPALSGLGVTGASVSIPLTAAVTAAQSTSNKDEAARIKLKMVDGGSFNYRVPGPLKDVNGVFEYITGGVVDVSNAGITGWFANFLAAGAARITKYGQRVLAAGGILSGYLEE